MRQLPRGLLIDRVLLGLQLFHSRGVDLLPRHRHGRPWRPVLQQRPVLQRQVRPHQHLLRERSGNLGLRLLTTVGGPPFGQGVRKSPRILPVTALPGQVSPSDSALSWKE